MVFHWERQMPSANANRATEPFEASAARRRTRPTRTTTPLEITSCG
jgi:hypothetical protein